MYFSKSNFAQVGIGEKVKEKEGKNGKPYYACCRFCSACCVTVLAAIAISALLLLAILLLERSQPDEGKTCFINSLVQNLAYNTLDSRYSTTSNLCR